MPSANDIIASSLQSRIVRLEIGFGGVRRIGSPLSTGNPTEGGIIRKIFDFAGWLINGIKSLFRFSATGVWGGVVQTATYLWHFNWNASDEQLDAQLQALQAQLAPVLGGTLGNLAGYYVCGMLPASKLLRFNEALGARVLEEVSEEAFDEFAANLANLCRTAWYLTAAATITTAYKNSRRIIKDVFENPNSPQSQALEMIFGDKAQDAIAAWGEGNNQPWSFAGEVESRVDSIENSSLRNFTEEFIEEFFDSCAEAGYIVASGIDAWYAEQRLQRNILLGAEEAVEIFPNRESPERVVLVGRENILRPSITQMVAQAQLVENRDIGQFMGEPVREFLKAAPTKLSVKLVWSRFDTPPMFRGEVYKPPTLEIKGFKRTMLDFDLIKTLMGGANGRLWGRFWASCSLVDPYGTIVARPRLYAGSEDQAEDLLTSLLSLSDFEIGTMSTGEEKRVGRRASGRAMAKETLPVYPAYLTILNAEKVINETEGRAQISGSYKRRDDRLPLWVSTKPDDWEERIADLLTAPGADSPTP